MTLEVRSWDNPSLKNFELTNKSNIYAPGSLEFYLVEGVIAFMQEYRFQIYDNYTHYTSENLLGNQILKILAKNKFFLPMDSWAKNHLGPKAIWHARVSGALKPRPLLDRFPGHKDSALFGVFMEAGLTNIAVENSFLEKLKKTSPDDSRLNHLLSVANIAQAKRQEYGIPSITHGAEPDQITISNLSSYLLNNCKQIPIQTWNQVDTADVLATTRGLFHHLGDEMAYIMASLTLGECCVLGQDDFGDIVVLQHLEGSDKMYGKDKRYCASLGDKKTILMGYKNLTGSVFNSSDFNFIYGVPKTHAMMPTAKNNIFNHLNDNKNNCALSSIENNTLDNQFWLNQEFLGMAGREIKEYTIKEFTQKFYSALAPHLLDNDLLDTLLDSTKASDFLYRYKKKDEATLELIQKIDTLIQKDFSYFVKTVAHKVNCTVINPQNNSGMGFFSKSGEEANTESNFLNLSFLINRLMHHMNGSDLEKLTAPIYKSFTQEFLKDSIIEFFLKTPTEFWKKEEKHLYQYWSDLDMKALVVSSLVGMDYEYRMFVINGKLVATTACFRNTTPFNAWSGGIVDPRLCQGHNAIDTVMTQETRDLAAKYAKFARKFIRKIKKVNPKILNYVLDVCQSVDKDGNKVVIPIEVNSINYSGAYQVDMRRVVAAVAGKPTQKEFINEMLDLGEIMETHAHRKTNEEKAKAA